MKNTRNGNVPDATNQDSSLGGFSTVIRKVYGAERQFGGWGPSIKL